MWGSERVASDEVADLESTPKVIVTLLVHQFVAFVGVMFLTAALAAAWLDLLSPLHRFSMFTLLTGTPYFPVQVFVAILAGWLINDLFGHRSMLWIWVLPFAWLVFSFTRLPAVAGFTLQGRFSYFVGEGCRMGNGCFDQLVITAPFYWSVAYSIGALLQRIFPLRSIVARKKLSGVVLAVGVMILLDFALPFLFRFKNLWSQTLPAGALVWGWKWRLSILVLTLVLFVGLAMCLIYFAIKMRQSRQGRVPHDPR